jgi:tetrahydromethanopterin S-methyltransferase subunit G
MPTQEERIGTLEFNLHQFKTETIKAYGDMAFEMTIIKGLTQDAITRLATLSNTVEKRLDRVDTRLDGMNAHLESVDKRLSSLEVKVDTIQNTLAQILERLSEKP